MPFTHLHVHSHYSLLDGLPKIGELVSYAKDQGFKALALTEHGNMYSAIEFYQACQEKNIKPIIGSEIYLTKGSHLSKSSKLDSSPYHLTLLCKNETGYKNLVKLTTIAHLEGFYYKPRIDMELIKEHSEGLIALSGCLQGPLSQTFHKDDEEAAQNKALELQNIFGKDSFFIEIQRHTNDELSQNINQQLVKLSKELEIPLVATNDVHYLRPADKEVQDILVCIQTQRTVNEQNRLTMMESDLDLKSEEEMQELFSDLPEAIANTQKITEMCNLEIELGKIKLPHFEVPGDDHEGYLRQVCEEALPIRFPDLFPGKDLSEEQKKDKQEILDRFEYEMGVIAKTGYADYFLIVSDFVNFAKNNGIVVGPGRGSAAGSIVAYLLNITNIDPIKYNLVFERFLNPERISMPDIDIDFADDRRDEVIDYVSEKYGSDKVAQIITFGTMAARAAVRDTGRVLAYPYAYCDKVAKLIPMFSSLAKALETVPELKDMYETDPQAKRLLDLAKKLEGVARHASTHACGVVITKDPIDTYMPRQYASASDKTIVTQFSLHPVEDMGLLKMDFLGLKNLTIVDRTLKIIKRNKDVDIDLDNIPLDDKITYQLLKKALTTGVFQLESAGMKRYLKQLKPTDIEDIIAMVALYRPGPMELIPDYISGKHGKRSASYLHEKLKPILEPTYGVAVYQEQVLQIARDLAGFSLGEADILRKAVGKKIASLLAEQKVKFISGCINNGVDKSVAEKVFAFIEPFAGYGFNRAHAACYAMIAYQTAYLKANFPTEFMASLLTSDQENIDRVAIEVNECEQMGISVLPPNVNESYGGFTVIETKEGKEGIRFGLDAVKNVGHNLVDIIVDERKEKQFANLEEFLHRIPPEAINKKSLESLIKCGTMDFFGRRNQMLENMDRILKYSKQIHKDKESGQETIFALTGQSEIPKLQLADAPHAPKRQRLNWEKELLGLYVTEHPTSEFKPFLDKYTTPLNNIIKQEVKGARELVVGGLITTVQRIVTKKGDPMIFVTIEDPTSAIEIVVFPNLYAETPNVWQEDNFVMVSGKISARDSIPKILANKVKVLTTEEIQDEKRGFSFDSNIPSYSHSANNNPRPISATGGDPLQITVPPYTKKDTFYQLKEILQRYPGEQPVILKIPTKNGKYKEVTTSLAINRNDELIKNIEVVVGQGTVS
ncbi:MAG: DNA polymerase III subunit alpha [bacterium]